MHLLLECFRSKIFVNELFLLEISKGIQGEIVSIRFICIVQCDELVIVEVNSSTECLFEGGTINLLVDTFPLLI